MTLLRDAVTRLMREGQHSLIEAFERTDGAASFRAHDWERPGGGGGWARILEGGAVWEKAGVNMSAVHGSQVPPSLARRHPQAAGQPFFATGVSLVLHPVNPFVPAFHANFRYFEVGGETDLWWFGGGADLTPSYPIPEDATHFHRSLRDLSERHPEVGPGYEELKRTCDEYFWLHHRNEMRGIGGIFFDELSAGSFEAQLAFVRDGFGTLLQAYLPLVEARRDTPFGQRERDWQLHRRGRYAEFNLVYDRGTLFGLQTNGNIEAILMSLPPLTAWRFDYQPEPGSREAQTLEYFQPHDWIDYQPARNLEETTQ